MIAPRRAFVKGLAAMPMATLPIVTSPEHELLHLGARFERAWEEEAACWRAFPSVKVSDEDDRRKWAVAEAAALCTGDIVAQIERHRATTLAGILVKARACAALPQRRTFRRVVPMEPWRRADDGFPLSRGCSSRPYGDRRSSRPA